MVLEEVVTVVRSLYVRSFIDCVHSSIATADLLASHLTSRVSVAGANATFFRTRRLK